MRSLSAGAAAVAALWALCGPALGQVQTRDTAPFVILPLATTGEVRVASRDEPLLVQPVNASRAVRLEEVAATPFKDRAALTPAGSTLFGAYDEPTQRWFYCVVADVKRWIGSSEEFACYEDTDDDGRFDQVRASGAPFLGVPLFVFQPGAPRPLAAPVRYVPVPYTEGPTAEYKLWWSAKRPRARSGEPPAKIRTVDLVASMSSRSQPLDDVRRELSADETGVLKYRGAEIEVLGFEPDGAIRYRVLKAMPRQIDRVTMTVTTTTTVVFVPG